MDHTESSRFRFNSPLLFQPCTYLGSPRKIYHDIQTHALKPVDGQDAPMESRFLSVNTFLYFIIFFQGLSHIFATNAIMTSSHFFLSRSADSIFGVLTMDILVVILCAGKILFLLISSAISSLFSPYSMLLSSQFGKAIVLLLLSIIAVASKATGNFFILLISVLSLNSAILSAISFLSIFLILSQLNVSYTHGYYNGQGIAGMLSCCFKLITMIILVPDRFSMIPQDSGIFFYFFTSSLILFIAAFLLLWKKEFFSFKPKSSQKDDSIFIESGLSSPPFALTSPKIATEEILASSQENEKLFSWTFHYYRIYKEIRIYFWCIIIHFFELILLVPNFIYMVKPVTLSFETYSHSKLINYETFPVISFLFYNIGDVFGRFILKYPYLTLSSKKSLAMATILSLLFIPLFLFSNVVDLSTSPKLVPYPIPRYLASDSCFLIIVSFFGFTSGYLSLSMLMFVPRSELSSSDKRIASSLCVYGLSFALFAGALTSLVLKSCVLFWN